MLIKIKAEAFLSQVVTCGGFCWGVWIGWLGSSLICCINDIAASTSTIVLREIVMDVKLMPMGDNPKNKPTSPSKPNVNATDNTNSSTMSSLFLLRNSMLTMQQPGRKVTNKKAKITRIARRSRDDPLGIRIVTNNVTTVRATIISNHSRGFSFLTLQNF